MYKIFGKHSIKAASENKKRKHRIFFGSREEYENLNLNCEFCQNKESFLQVREIFVESPIEEILQSNKIIILDGLEDPRNIGSIIRSAAILGFNVLIREGKGGKINETVLKCASGAVEIIKIAYIKNCTETIKKIKNNSFWVFALDEKGSETFNKVEKVCFVIGAEGDGISSLVKKNCDFLLKLSSEGNFSTYNASVAAAIAMYNFRNVNQNFIKY